MGFTYGWWGGRYKVCGKVSELGVPGAYRVVLFHRRTNKVVRTVFSAEDGSYCFPYVANDEFFIVAFDHGDNPVNAAISDYIIPEPMDV
jgi:hypothetical protein